MSDQVVTKPKMFIQMSDQFVTKPVQFIRDLCRALGIDPIAEPVRSITITVVAGELPKVVVEKYLTDRQAPAVIDLVTAADVTPVVVLREPGVN